MKSSGPELLFVGRFLITVSIFCAFDGSVKIFIFSLAWYQGNGGLVE